MHKNTQKIVLFLQAFIALVVAWGIKSRRNMANVTFKASATHKPLTAANIEYVVRITDWLVRYGAWHTGRKCFFRAYIIASVLHKWDTPVVMNVGLRELSGASRRQGHCWLSLHNEPIAEPLERVQSYPVDMGIGVNGVRYWYGPGNRNMNYASE